MGKLPIKPKSEENQVMILIKLFSIVNKMNYKFNENISLH